jgi:hypothetical protein
MAVKSPPSEPVLANLDGLLAELETIAAMFPRYPLVLIATAICCSVVSPAQEACCDGGH